MFTLLRFFQELNYSFTESINFHSILLKVFSSSLPIIKESTPKTSNIQPIFIVGMPRSGTSLVEQIIASHHNVHGAGELTNFKEILSPILENHLNQNKEAFLTKDILSIRKQYLDSLSRLNVPETVITDKMPTNFRLIGFILSAFPEAKIIHLKRDARATCWSIYKHYFSSGNGFTFNQGDLVEFYGLYRELMDFWHELFPGKIYDINYEKLTRVTYSKLIWRINNDKDSRMYSKNKKNFSYKHHLKWFKQTIKGNKELLYIARKEKKIIGIIRQIKKENKFFLSWALLREFRGKNYGTRLVKEFLKKNKITYFAVVHRLNIKSIIICKKVGFKFLRKKNDFLTFKKI